MTTLTIRHRTTYRYAHPASVCHNVARLEPRGDGRQRLLSTDLRIDPPPDSLQRGRDYFGNATVHFAVHAPHERLVIEATSRVCVSPPSPAPPVTEPWTAARDATLPGEVAQFRYDSPYIRLADDLADYARPSFPPGRPLPDAARDLMQRIRREFMYDPHATTIATPIAEVLRGRQGVCQDFAHLMVGCCRSLGLPARYVSGYLRTVPPAGKPRLIGADASHAWAGVYVPGDGWRDYDPTNAVEPALDHVTLAWGRDYDDVSPVKGVVFGGGEHAVAVAVDVEAVE